MKKVFYLLIIFLFLFCGCSENFAETINDMQEDSPLVVVGGKTILTITDYNRLVQEDILSSELLGTDRHSEEYLFTSAVEYALCTYYAEIYMCEADIDDVYTEYDDYISELKSNLESSTIEYLAQLRISFSMTEDEFREWYAYENYKIYSAENLMDDIGSTYYNLTDGDSMKEAILGNLYQLIDMYGFECYMDGYTDYIPDFEHIL